jgi:hypothetical protein
MKNVRINGTMEASTKISKKNLAGQVIVLQGGNPYK